VFLSIKKELLRHVYSWTTCCLYVGRNNYEYFRALGLPEEKLFYCPHSIEVQRFAEPHDQLERQAQHWRKTLQISEESNVLLFVGKFEARKQPIELMKTIAALPNDNIVLLMIGNGPLEGEVSSIAKRFPARFRLLPFQNQSKMPLVYRLGDLFVLPSIRGETWGLAVNEAIASGRRVLISDKVGCAPDLVMSNTEGAVFAAGDWRDFTEKLAAQLSQPMNSQHLRSFSRRFDLPETERKLCAALDRILPAAGSAKTYRDNLRHSLP
jgi:glycosyltransferase involved in cell wall biosynthesis